MDQAITAARSWTYFTHEGRSYRWDGQRWLSGWPKSVEAFSEDIGWFPTPRVCVLGRAEAAAEKAA